MKNLQTKFVGIYWLVGNLMLVGLLSKFPYKANKGTTRKMVNLSFYQTLTNYIDVAMEKKRLRRMNSKRLLVI